MYFEEALQLMRKGYYISRGIPGEKFRLYEGHFEIVNDDYPNGCHTNVPGDDLSSDRWELAESQLKKLEEIKKLYEDGIINH